jgi:hypothetical protein
VGRDESILRTQRRPFRGKIVKVYTPFFTFRRDAVTDRESELATRKMEQVPFVVDPILGKDDFTVGAQECRDCGMCSL